MIDRYYYYLLDNDSRILYDRIIDGIKHRCADISCKGLAVNASDVPAITNAVEYDNPELFYVDFAKFGFHHSYNSGNIDSVSIKYLYTVEDTFSLQAIADMSCKKIISKAELVGCTDLQKVWRLHDFLIDNVEYFHESLTRPGTFEWYRAKSILGMLLDKKAICSGISRAFKYILNQIGIRSIVVAGTAIDENNNMDGHEWNIVSIAGKSYHIDMTWDITESTQKRRSYNYFNLNDKLIFKDHFTDSILPKCCYDDDNFFVRNLAVISSKKALRKYLRNGFPRFYGDYYYRVDCSCDLKEVVDQIEKYIIEQSNRSLTWETIINERQKIIRIMVNNG